MTCKLGRTPVIARFPTEKGAKGHIRKLRSLKTTKGARFGIAVNKSKTAFNVVKRRKTK